MSTKVLTAEFLQANSNEGGTPIKAHPLGPCDNSVTVTSVNSKTPDEQTTNAPSPPTMDKSGTEVDTSDLGTSV